MTNIRRRRLLPDTVGDLSRALSLYVSNLGAKGILAWSFTILAAVYWLFVKPGAGEDRDALNFFGLGFLYLGMATGPLIAVRQSRAALEFFEARPLRSPTKLLVLLPQCVVGAVVIGVAAIRNAWSPAEAIAFLACCCWAGAVGLIVLPSDAGRFLGWLALLLVGPIPIVTKHDGGWPTVAAVTSVLAVIGWIAAPRRLSWRQVPGDARSKAAGTRHPDRVATAPSERRPRKKRATTWFDVCRLVTTGRHRGAAALTIFQVTFVGLLVGVAVARRDQLGIVCAVGVQMAITTAGMLAAGSSRTVFEFLVTRPLGRLRLVLGTVVPYFALVLALPAAILVWVPPGWIRLGSHRITVQSLALRLALGCVACLFSFAIDAYRDRRAGFPFLNVAGFVGVVLIVFPMMFQYVSARLPLPPVWLMGAYAAASAWWWYRRLPWRSLSRAQ